MIAESVNQLLGLGGDLSFLLEQNLIEYLKKRDEKQYLKDVKELKNKLQSLLDQLDIARVKQDQKVIMENKTKFSEIK